MNNQIHQLKSDLIFSEINREFERHLLQNNWR